MEIWREIDGFPGYEVSSFGNVSGPLGILSPFACRKGYYRVSLYRDTVRYVYLVHRLVGRAFIPSIENKPEIDHIDNNKANNRIENLRWADRSDQSINRPFKNMCGHRHIQARNDGYYSVRINRKGHSLYRTVKTLEEAIAVRDKLLTEFAQLLTDTSGLSR